MDIQDREFDELLRSKLDGFEAQPSAKVWPGISDGLDSATRRKTILPWLTIAASIAVLIGMGVLFMLKKTNIHSPNPVKNFPFIDFPFSFPANQRESTISTLIA